MDGKYRVGIEMSGKPIEYKLIRSRRSTVGILLPSADEVIVKAPLHLSRIQIEEIVYKKADWILKKRQLLEKAEVKKKGWTPLKEDEKDALRVKAKQKIMEKTEHYAKIIGEDYGTLRIKDQKTRWGSCSSKRNLNINWRLIMAPECVLDYVIIHELCHLKHMNHSRAFWSLVEQYMPDYRKAKDWLRENGEELQAK